jgi:hypothetical protein
MTQSASTRNRKSETRQLQALVGVRLRPEEHARALEFAESRGLTLPELLRTVLRERLETA